MLSKPQFQKLMLTTLFLTNAFSGQIIADPPSPMNPNDIAVEAYVYLYPLVLMDITRKQFTNVKKWDGENPFAPMNAFGHFRKFPPLDFKDVVRPNFDTLYSIAWIDLAQEPMILSVPDSQGRYYLLPTLDMWTNVFGSPGWRTTGTIAGHFAYCPPGWKGVLPDRVTRIDAPTPTIWLIGRTETKGEQDYDAVHAFQDGLKLTPLSQWGSEWQPPEGVIDPSVDMETPPMEQVENMSGKQFFEYAADLMKRQPPHVTDFSQIARLKHIGIVPGENFTYSDINPTIQTAFDKAPESGMKLIRFKHKKMGTVVNEWQMLLNTVGVYGIDYLQRAAIAHVGLGANQLPDAVYPQLATDSTGQPMSSAHDYVLHFEKDEIPPAEAFWSVTLYNSKGFTVPNPINRANLSSWMPLKYNNDGSLDLHFQCSVPEKDQESNWLPTPKQGEWNLTMRLYAPKQKVLDGNWAPPPLKRVTIRK